MIRPVEVLMDPGLGNEMFQYAMGRTLATRLGRPLVLDISLFFESPGWSFNLPCFRLGRQRVRDWPYWRWSARNKGLMLLDAIGIRPMPVVTEPHLDYWEGIEAVRGPCILRGFWQSERYFESVAPQLREEFTLVPSPDPRTAECLRRIRHVRSIGLHVRRGDYLPAPGEEDFHGTCPREYYDAAMKLVTARLGSEVELFVFSDDIAWTRENIRYDVPTVYVDWNAGRDYEDFRLMSACRALIIANSTFSWWAGWLNPDPDKVVVAPKVWFLAPGVVSDLPNSAWITAL